MSTARKLDDHAARESTLSESVAELGVGRLRTVKATARPVKVVASDGSVRVMTHGEVVQALAEREGIESRLRDESVEFAIKMRRAQGLPDLCEADGCGAVLGMSKMSVSLRNRRPHPWVCRECSNNQRWPDRHTITTEIAERRARGKADVCEVPGCDNDLVMGALSIRRRNQRPHPWMCRSCSCKSRMVVVIGPAPDTCAESGCNNELSMSYGAVKVRRRRPQHNWRCCSCKSTRRRDTPVQQYCDGDGCGVPLSMSPGAIRARSRRPRPLCQSCAPGTRRTVTRR